MNIKSEKLIKNDKNFMLHGIKVKLEGKKRKQAVELVAQRFDLKAKNKTTILHLRRLSNTEYLFIFASDRNIRDIYDSRTKPSVFRVFAFSHG